MNSPSLFSRRLTGILFLSLCMVATTSASADGNDSQGGKTTGAKEQSRVLDEIERIRKSKQPSVSRGKLRDGVLEHPAELAAPDGVGYYLAHPNRGTNFGSDRLVFGLMTLSAHLKKTLGEQPVHRLRIHDLSSKSGGKQQRHINHQMGLDVDLSFYATDTDGNPAIAGWTSYDARGRSVKGDLRFDVSRNWEIVAGILQNECFGEIRAILVSDPLKEKLLAHANKQLKLFGSNDTAKSQELRRLIDRASVLLRQPTSSPHDNHFHLSLKL